MKKVTITYEFESCRWCPFKSEFRDMGCSDTLCGKQEEMRSIYNKNTITIRFHKHSGVNTVGLYVFYKNVLLHLILLTA